MHRYRDNKGRFVSSKYSKTNPPPPTNPTNTGAGKLPPGESSRGASKAPEEEPKMEESALGRAEHESVERSGDTQNPVFEPSISGMVEEEVNVATETETFGFPILDISRNINMKNIPLSSLPTFRGMSTEDPDLLFEFDILCRSYNYSNNAQKLKLFPTTMKDSALRWFMSLGENTILSWDHMKDTFLQKYQDYCKDNAKNDIFKMQQTEDESPEDYLERFLYNY
jgi:hypothetical protein